MDQVQQLFAGWLHARIHSPEDGFGEAKLSQARWCQRWIVSSKVPSPATIVHNCALIMQGRRQRTEDEMLPHRRRVFEAHGRVVVQEPAAALAEHQLVAFS